MKKRLAVAAFLTIAILPLAAGLVYTILYSVGVIGALGQGFTLEYWEKTLTNGTFWASIGLSALVASLVCMVSTALALGCLLYLRPSLEHRSVRFLLHWPLALPPLVAAFFSFQWLGNSGMLARFFYRLGWIRAAEDFPALINDPGYFGVVFTLTLLTFPFFLLLLMDYYRAAGLGDLSQMAGTLGASSRQIKARVLAPILLRRAMPAVTLYFVFLIGAYEVPLLLGRQSPAMLSVFISQKFGKFNLLDLPVAYVTTVVYACVVLLFVFTLLKSGMRNEDRGMRMEE